MCNLSSDWTNMDRFLSNGSNPMSNSPFFLCMVITLHFRLQFDFFFARLVRVFCHNHPGPFKFVKYNIYKKTSTVLARYYR